MDDDLARRLAARNPEADWNAAAEVARRLAPTLVGLSVSAARQRALADRVGFRVVRGAGAPRAVTRDLRPNRINVDVQNGVIVAAEMY